MDTHENNHVYRLRLSKRRGGDVQYFEDRHSLSWELMRASLQALENTPGSKTLRAWAAEFWRMRWFGKNAEFYEEIVSVRGVDEFRDGAWVPMTYTITPPELRIEGEVVK